MDQDTIKYHLYSQYFRQHAYEIFSTMRENDPVLYQPGIDGKTPIWFISRYEDVEAVLRDDQRFVLDAKLALAPEDYQRRYLSSPISNQLDNHLLTKEGEDHRRLRSLVTQAFTPRRIAGLRPRIQAIADQLIDQMSASSPGSQPDLVDSYAFPLPLTVIAELLGIPVEDQDKFRRWSDEFVTPAITPEAQQRFFQEMQAFIAYLSALFEARRQQPRDDLISALLQAEEAGDHLSTEELFSMVVLLIVAGHETTVSLIGNATVQLLTHPNLLARLKSHPEQMPQAVEELLRYDPPVERSLTRYVAQDVVLGGQSLHRGDLVILLLGSANRDQRIFPDADQLNIDRETKAHIAFGKGVHYCLGAPLARLEAEIALNTLLRRLPNLRLAVSQAELEYRMVPLFHAYTHIPVCLEANCSSTVTAQP
jgi:cytochrome P450